MFKKDRKISTSFTPPGDNSHIMRQLRKLQNYFWLKLNNRVYRIPTERLGSEYGGWIIPENFLNQDSVCCLAGAGLDISFDVAIVEKYQSHVFIFDPTPKARAHYEKLCQNTLENKPTSINSKEDYHIQKKNLKHLSFFGLGLWDKSEFIKFYEPSNPEHISHSALNIQKTDKYFEAEVVRLGEFMQQQKYEALDLLKLDIEGAEYKVIDSILEDELNIKVICIEFDEIHSPLDKKYLSRIWQRIQALQKNAYLLIGIDTSYNFTFMREDVYKQLKT